MIFGILLTLFTHLAFCVDGNEGGHGGDPVINRILIARHLSLQIAARADKELLNSDQKIKMIKLLSQRPKFSNAGEKVTILDKDEKEVEVAGKYLEKSDQIIFNVDLCKKLDLTLVDAIALYLHEAGYVAGLSKCMVKNRDELLEDIGYRLVLEEKAKKDSLFKDGEFFNLFNKTEKETIVSQPKVEEIAGDLTGGLWHEVWFSVTGAKPETIANWKSDITQSVCGLIAEKYPQVKCYAHTRWHNVFFIHDTGKKPLDFALMKKERTFALMDSLHFLWTPSATIPTTKMDFEKVPAIDERNFLGYDSKVDENVNSLQTIGLWYEVRIELPEKSDEQWNEATRKVLCSFVKSLGPKQLSCYPHFISPHVFYIFDKGNPKFLDFTALSKDKENAFIFSAIKVGPSQLTKPKGILGD